MTAAKHIYAVDYHQEILDEQQSNFGAKNITYVKNNGVDFPGIPSRSVDLVFSFGVFVHLDLDVIDFYLKNIENLLRPESNVIIHYADITEPMGERIKEFSRNEPGTMRRLVRSHVRIPVNVNTYSGRT